MDIFMHFTGKISIIQKTVMSGEEEHWYKTIIQDFYKLPTWTDEAFMADKLHK